jgi:hypothetical protein
MCGFRSFSITKGAEYHNAGLLRLCRRHRMILVCDAHGMHRRCRIHSLHGWKTAAFPCPLAFGHPKRIHEERITEVQRTCTCGDALDEAGGFTMSRRMLLAISLGVVILVPTSQAGIIFHRNKPAQPNQPAQPDQAASLLQILQTDGDEQHRLSAVESLGKLDPKSNPSIVPSLQQSMQQDASPRVRNAAKATLTHYQQNGYRPGAVQPAIPNTPEPPLAIPGSPMPVPIQPGNVRSMPPANPGNTNTMLPLGPPANARPVPPNQPQPRVANQAPRRDSAEPPLANVPPPPVATSPPAPKTPPVIARSPYTPAPVTVEPPLAAPLNLDVTLTQPTTPRVPVTPSAPTVVKPNAPKVSTAEPPHAVPTPSKSVPAKTTSTPTKPEEDGPLLNPPG